MESTKDLAIILSALLVYPILISVIIGGVKKIIVSLLGNIGFLFINRVSFVGVVHHELSHLLAVIVTGARVVKFELFKVDKINGTLGGVTFAARGPHFLRLMQTCIISAAPTFTGTFTSIFIWLYTPTISETWLKYLMYYILISILLHTNMSKVDIKVYLRGCTYLVIIAIILYYIIGALV